jgi:hypothetical protein
MAHNVKCKVCGITFDRDKEEAVSVGSRRYAHAKCANGYEPSKESQDLAELHQYLKNLFKDNYNYVVLNKQIELYKKQHQYTYSGILKSLIYWYEIQGNTTEESNNRIGIVPYIYEEARQYYYDLFIANESNKDKNLEEFKTPEIIEVRIKPPKKEHKLRLFNLDD